jgi:hypothetical protein
MGVPAAKVRLAAYAHVIAQADRHMVGSAYRLANGKMEAVKRLTDDTEVLGLNPLWVHRRLPGGGTDRAPGTGRGEGERAGETERDRACRCPGRTQSHQYVTLLGNCLVTQESLLIGCVLLPSAVSYVLPNHVSESWFVPHGAVCDFSVWSTVV